MIWPTSDEGIIEQVVLVHEGGYVDNPADPGGPTRFGVTIAALSAFRGRPCTKADIVALQRPEAIALYLKNYIAKPGFDKITSLMVRTAAVDMAVLFGQTGADEALEQTEHAALGLKQAVNLPAADGMISDDEAEAINKLEPRAVVNALSVIRILHHATVVRKKPEKVIFIEGWDARACEFIQ